MHKSALAAASAALALSVSAPAVLAQQTAPAAPALPSNLCEELARFIERRGTTQPPSPVSLDQARGFQRANNLVACRDGFVRIQGAGITLPAAVVAVVQVPDADRAANIVVQQPAPTVRVEQASPQVTVQQPQPQVTVRQPTPEIIVRQPQPTVTVDIPQPEIILRLPQPDVSVAMAPPQVQVNQPPPQVQVVRPEQPQVQVQPSQPQVIVQRQANAEPNVQLQRADTQPTVRYERAEPKVVVNPAQGQPQVRIERMGEAGAGQATPAMGAAMGATRTLTVTELERMELYNAAGNQIGRVQNVLVGPNNQVQLVVAYGGFLGVGDRRVALPLDQVRVQSNPDRLVTGPSDDQLKALPAYTQAPQGYRDADAGYRATVAYAPVGGTTAQPAGTTRSFAVSALMDREVYNLRGEQLGDIERVLMGADNKLHVVLGHGGFLGLGEKQILVPMDRIQVREDRLVIQGLTDAEIRAMPEFRFDPARGYRDVERTTNADLTVYRG